MMDAGADIRAASEALGYSDPSITLRALGHSDPSITLRVYRHVHSG